MAERKQNSWVNWLGWGMVAVIVSLIVIALALPAVQQVREAARREQVEQVRSNLHQIGLALQNYHNNVAGDKSGQTKQPASSDEPK